MVCKQADLILAMILYGDRYTEEEKKKILLVKNKKHILDENNIVIGNEVYVKGTQFDKIADKVLEICNVYRGKSKHNNTSLKARSGKTMITQGMTVRQFEKKYNLNE